jgi:hypothetical protein
MKTLFALLLLVTPAFAQAAPQQPSPQQQALGQKLLEEINSGIALRAELLQAQQKIKELQETKCDAKTAAPSAPPAN